jgi:hypothetical protein
VFTWENSECINKNNKFLEEVIGKFPLIWHGEHRKCSRCLATIRGIHRHTYQHTHTYFPWDDTGHIENDAFNNSSIVPCVFLTAVTFLPSRWLARIGGFLPSRCIATIRRFLQSRCLATVRGLLLSRCGATIRGIRRHTRTHTHIYIQQRDLISLYYFSK